MLPGGLGKKSSEFGVRGSELEVRGWKFKALWCEPENAKL
jgi:hypothetical protein